MQLPMLNNRGGDESKLSQTRYWISMGGYGVSPEMLVLTGFWPDSAIENMQRSGIDTSQTVEQIFGGTLRFRLPPGKNFRKRLTEILDGLNMILQVKRHIKDVMDYIPVALNKTWETSKDSEYIRGLSEPVKKLLSESGLLKEEKKYVIAEDKNSAGQLLQIIPLLEGLHKRIGYFPNLYREANTLFHLMLMETVTLSMNNLSDKNSVPQPQYIDLEALADESAYAIAVG